MTIRRRAARPESQARRAAAGSGRHQVLAGGGARRQGRRLGAFRPRPRARRHARPRPQPRTAAALLARWQVPAPSSPAEEGSSAREKEVGRGGERRLNRRRRRRGGGGRHGRRLPERRWRSCVAMAGLSAQMVKDGGGRREGTGGGSRRRGCGQRLRAAALRSAGFRPNGSCGPWLWG